MLAMAIWDIVSMKSLCSHDFSTADEIISQQVDLIGPLPPTWRAQWAHVEEEVYDKDGKRKNPDTGLWPSLDVAFEDGMQKYRRKLEVGAFDEPEQKAFLSLIRRMLTFDPTKRISVDEVLRSEWMVRWVMPDLKRSLHEAA